MKKLTDRQKKQIAIRESLHKRLKRMSIINEKAATKRLEFYKRKELKRLVNL